MASPPSILRIATRKSPLALWQAEYVKRALLQHHEGLQVELLPMSTQGDRILDTPLAKIGGKGLFIKELETAILDGRADIAVHSMKDVPMELPEGLCLGAICEREDPHDALLSSNFASLQDLPQGAVVGTSSLRRSSQLLAHLPHLQIADLRGNVNTRLAKLEAGDYDAIVLAYAGLKRLGLADKVRELIDPASCLPAAGQGAVGIEARADDQAIATLLAPLHHRDSAICVRAERALNTALQGGCQVPIAAQAVLSSENQSYNDSKRLRLIARVCSLDGQTLLEDSGQGDANEPEILGKQVARQLQAQGADAILQAIRSGD